MNKPTITPNFYSLMDNLTLSYDGNRLTGVTEASADYDFVGSFEYKRANGSQYLYNANGSLIADKSRGIAYITYAPNGTPQKIYFTNGNVTKYRYSATGQKLSVEYYVAAPNVTVTFGAEPDALTQSQTMYAGSKQYLLGGSLVMEDGMVDKYLFGGGYAKASAVNSTTYNFSFYYYNQDHLGNNREVVDSAGVVRQITHYYPFGTSYADPSTILNPSLQPYKYNGKELDRMHGLDTYDFGARTYFADRMQWGQMDPLCEKYYDVSPYMYCMDNPIFFEDEGGKYPVITITNIKSGITARQKVVGDYSGKDLFVDVPLYIATVTDTEDLNFNMFFLVTRDAYYLQEADHHDFFFFAYNLAFEPVDEKSNHYETDIMYSYPSGNNTPALKLTQGGSEVFFAESNEMAVRFNKRDKPNVAKGVMLHVGGNYLYKNNPRTSGSYGCFGITNGSKKYSNSYSNNVIRTIINQSKKSKKEKGRIDVIINKRRKLNYSKPKLFFNFSIE